MMVIVPFQAGLWMAPGFYRASRVVAADIAGAERIADLLERGSVMDEFILNFTVDVEQVGNGLAIQTPIPLQLGYGAGRWRARCECPAVDIPKLESLEKAVIAGARQAAAELQAAVVERPRVIARITPADIPDGMFS
jgi:hypothetical protein